METCCRPAVRVCSSPTSHGCWQARTPRCCSPTWAPRWSRWSHPTATRPAPGPHPTATASPPTTWAVDENLTASRTSRWSAACTTSAGAPRGAGGRAARGLRPRGRRRPTRADVLGRDAPAARPRGRARRAPSGALPRRADDRARHPQPPGALGHDRGARRRGHDRAPDDAVPRRGRPSRRPHRRYRPRARDRRGLARRAEGAGRRRPSRGPPRGRGAHGRGDRRPGGDRGRAPVRRGRRRQRAAPHGRRAVTDAVRRLDAAGIGIADIAVRRPTLDDVFLS